MGRPAKVRVMPQPLLYTFRRCPYAMRARWAIHVAGVAVDQTEVSLRAKPPAMLAALPKGTVPVLVLPDGAVIDQSLAIMLWALRQHDPERWLTPERASLADMLALIDAGERDFKPHLDRYKYPSRYTSEWAPGQSEAAFSDQHLACAIAFLQRLAARLAGPGAQAYLFGAPPALADFALVPFVRQLVRHDRPRAVAVVPPAVIAWTDPLLARPDFDAIMRKAPGAG